MCPDATCRASATTRMLSSLCPYTSLRPAVCRCRCGSRSSTELHMPHREDCSLRQALAVHPGRMVTCRGICPRASTRENQPGAEVFSTATLDETPCMPTPAPAIPMQRPRSRVSSFDRRCQRHTQQAESSCQIHWACPSSVNPSVPLRVLCLPLCRVLFLARRSGHIHANSWPRGVNGRQTVHSRLLEHCLACRMQNEFICRRPTFDRSVDRWAMTTMSHWSI